MNATDFIYQEEYEVLKAKYDTKRPLITKGINI